MIAMPGYGTDYSAHLGGVGAVSNADVARMAGAAG